MADRNRSDLDREQRGSSNPNQTERPEDRTTSSQESGMGDTNRGNQERDRGVGSETDDRQDNLGTNRPSGDRSSNIEGDENLNRR